MSNFEELKTCRFNCSELNDHAPIYAIFLVGIYYSRFVRRWSVIGRFCVLLMWCSYLYICDTRSYGIWLCNAKNLAFKSACITLYILNRIVVDVNMTELFFFYRSFLLVMNCTCYDEFSIWCMHRFKKKFDNNENRKCRRLFLSVEYSILFRGVYLRNDFNFTV